VRIVWHDSPERVLAQQGLALAEQRPVWRLERLRPDKESWAPGALPPVLATGRALSSLHQALPDPLVPVAALEARAANVSLVTEDGPVSMTLLNGTLRAVAAEHRFSRLRLEGVVGAVESLASVLVSEVRLAVPRASLAAEAFAVASGTPSPARRLGAPELPEGLSVAEAFAHVVGHLSDVILYFAPLAAGGRAGPEPVHQMRVAVRRLRSAIKVFGRAVHGPALNSVDAGLKMLGAKLAPTRDWDVFLTETAAPVVAAFPTEARLQRLLGAAERRRGGCHDELHSFLGSVEFRRLGIELACLAGEPTRPVTPDQAEQSELLTPLASFAAQVLSKRHKRFLQIDDDIAALEPSALHAIRLRAKRLRYAAEIFAGLYPGKAALRFIRRLSLLQDRLGALNDGTVAASLLGELTNGNHAFATGLVLGFIGAHTSNARERIAKAWQRFRRLAPFWE
jgi:CHAD domain-containing protein